MEEKKEKFRFGVNGKLYLVISLLVFTTILIVLLVNSFFYIRKLITAFQNKTEQVASANKEVFKEYDLRTPMIKMLSEETVKVQQEYLKTQNEYPMIYYFESLSTDGFQGKAWFHLRTLEGTFDVSDVFIAGCNDDACYYLTSGMSNMVDQGKRLPFNLSDIPFDDGFSVSRVRSEDPVGDDIVRMKSDYYFVSVAPVTFYGDWSFWIVCVNDVNNMMKEISIFMGQMFLLFIILTTVSALIGVLILRRQITSPIILIKKCAETFAAENSAKKGARPYAPPIHSKDELEDLSNSLFELEQNVAETQEELGRISEEKGRMAAQMNIAKGIQEGVLPKDFPEHRDFDIYAIMDPAKEVGGDLYDFFLLDDTHLFLVIGDVSDKGIPAALFMMTAKTLLHMHAKENPDPSTLLASVNNLLTDINTKEMFVTVWVGVLDLETGTLTAANAGHEYPMVRSGKEPFEIFKEPHGMPLGIMPGNKYENYEIILKPGDGLFLYSDGATDAINTENEQIGVDRLLEVVRKADAEDTSPKGLITNVKASLDQWSQDAYQFDDITMLSIVYHPDGKTDEHSAA